MKIIKIFIISITISIFFLNSITYAFDKNDSYDEILTLYKQDNSYVKELKQYLVNKNFDSKEYDKIISLSNKYLNSEVEKYWLIETGRLFFDDIIFDYNNINNIYKKKIVENNNDTKKAYIDTKKELISIIDDLYYMYADTFDIIEIDENQPPSENEDFDDEFIKQENERKLTLIKNTFKKHFGRYPSKEEEDWLLDINTMKYALYSGSLNKSLSKNDIENIDSGMGYKLFNIDEDTFIEFWSYIYKHQKLEDLELEYIKNIYKLKNIRNKIIKEHSIDIYEKLLDYERHNIFLVASQEIEFNENRALDYTLEILKNKNLISLPTNNNPNNPSNDNNSQNNNTNNQDKPSIEQDFSNDNFFDDLLFSKDNLNNNKFYQIIKQAVRYLYEPQKQNKNGNYIFFKINNIEFETNILLNKDKDINKEVLNDLFYTIQQKIDMKTIISKNKVLIQGNQKIVIENIKTIYNNEKSNFENLKNLFNKLDIELYIKYKSFNEKNTSN